MDRRRFLQGLLACAAARPALASPSGPEVAITLAGVQAGHPSCEKLLRPYPRVPQNFPLPIAKM